MYETTEKDDDHGIRLFGRKIPLPECRIKDACSSTKKTEAENNSEQQENSSSSSDENQPSKPMEEDNNIETRDEDKVLKKPDKILQCPRCNSLDTKFCYFNNYNVNQPRHFCKNCQRYWTAGGTMRNVPIGAGRRKNKHLASQYRQQQQIIVTTSDGNIPFPTEAVAVVSSSTSSDHHQHTNGAAHVLKFGPDMPPICESMEESMLNLRDQKRYAIADATSNVDQYKKEEPSLCVSSVTNSSTQGNESSEHNWLQCYPVPPWVVPWNPTWKNIATTTTAAIPYSTNHHTAMQWCPTPMLPIQGISPPLQQLVSAPYWSGGALLIGGGSAVCPSASSSISTTCFNGSTILGKHTRDTTFLTDEEGMLDKSVLVQTKTIRIDDKDIEASKSPITATLLH